MDTKKCGTSCGCNKILPKTTDYFYRRGNGFCTLCKACTKKKNKEYKELNKEALKKKQRVYQSNNKELRNRTRRRYFKNNPHGKIIENYRKRVSDFFKRVGKSSSTATLLGFMPNEWDDTRSFLLFVQSYIEAMWLDGMTWDNYGSDWHLDHIVPISLIGHEDCLVAFHFTNLQPMWAMDNFRKHNHIDQNHIPWKVCELWCLNPHC